MIRTGAGMPITRFAALIGVPRRTYQHRLAKHRAGDPPKGPWPAPVVDRIEPAVAKLAAEWPAWGHRKIWAMGRHAGWEFGSQSSAGRAMARRGLLGPVRCQAERRQLAKARRAVFADVPSRPNRVWQADFSEFETGTEGTRQLGGVVDYVSKLVLACPVTATQTAGDLCAAFDAAEARAGELLGHQLVEDCTDGDTGEITPIVIVTDNGPATKSAAVARWFAARPHIAHVRTRHRSPHTNGVIERWFEALKYERLYRHDIATGIDLTTHITDFIDEYNRIRPHESLDWARPLDAHQQTPDTQTKTPEI
ncbi:transposase [Candidatus Poriferisodalis sp.]|uniref:transposase n=1 Tax=Candidatus Poriferisodalis sp. TaxID=3101277 RepID=UPI003C6F580C